MDVFGSFCLACDAQTNGQDYCTQTCRLAGLDGYSTSEPASPIYCDTNTIARRPPGSVGSGLYLPPAIDFSVYRVSPSHTVSTLRRNGSTESWDYIPSQYVSTRYSMSSHTQLSEKARIDLDSYVGAFDQTRTLKRRISMQSYDSDRSSRH